MEWIRQLPDRQRNSLETLLESVNSYEDVYSEAENASVGQIWVAMSLMNEKIQRLESLVKAQRRVLNEMGKGDELDRHLNQELEKSLRNY